MLDIPLLNILRVVKLVMTLKLLSRRPRELPYNVKVLKLVRLLNVPLPIDEIRLFPSSRWLRRVKFPNVVLSTEVSKLPSRESVMRREKGKKVAGSMLEISCELKSKKAVLFEYPSELMYAIVSTPFTGPAEEDEKSVTNANKTANIVLTIQTKIKRPMRLFSI